MLPLELGYEYEEKADQINMHLEVLIFDLILKALERINCCRRQEPVPYKPSVEKDPF